MIKHISAATIVLAVVALLAGGAWADTIELTVDDNEGRPTWAGVAWGTPPAEPMAGNDYVVPEGLLVRTPENMYPTVDVFAGDSITIQGRLMVKAGNNTGTDIHEANYILDGAEILHGSAGRTAVLDGTMDVLAGTVNSLVARPYVIDALLTGTGALVWEESKSDGTACVFTNAANLFTGTYDLTQAGDYSLEFEYSEAAGASLEMATGQGTLLLDRTLSFKSVMLDDTALADGTYSADDAAIAGYLATGSDGTLVVNSALPEPTTVGLLSLGALALIRRRK